MLVIDGSYLEGGGQILRNALSLSCILQRPIQVTNIRANRPKPGLSQQHLHGLQLLANITRGKVKGDFERSTKIEFDPGKIISGFYTVDARTAASISLILQAALPVLAFGSKISRLELIGGTNVGMAPQVDYITEVLRPNLEMFGVSFDFDLIRRGYFPRGGGSCNVTVPAVCQLNAVDLTRFGECTEICGWCYVAGRLPLQLAEEMKTSTTNELHRSVGKQVHINIEAYKESPVVARDNGSGLVVKAVTSERCTLGASALGERQVNGAELGKKVAVELASYIEQGTCVDCYAQDQLILFMALADGESRICTNALTNHTRTAMHVAELMTGVKFHIDEVPNSSNIIISCKGIGHRNEQM